MLVRAVVLAHSWHGGRGYGACFWHWREKATVLSPKLQQLLNTTLQVQLALGQLRSVLEITAQQQQQSTAAAAQQSTAGALRAVSEPVKHLLLVTYGVQAGGRMVVQTLTFHYLQRLLRGFIEWQSAIALGRLYRMKRLDQDESDSDGALGGVQSTFDEDEPWELENLRSKVEGLLHHRSTMLPKPASAAAMSGAVRCAGGGDGVLKGCVWQLRKVRWPDARGGALRQWALNFREDHTKVRQWCMPVVC